MKSGHDLQSEKPPRSGYRIATSLMEFSRGSVIVERWIPDDEVYPQEISRLSQMITRDADFSLPIWNDALNAVISVRESTIQIDALQFTFREFHDADARSEDSLLQIDLFAMSPGTVVDGKLIYPTEILAYSPVDHMLSRFNLPTSSKHMSNISEESLNETYERLHQTGETQVSDREWTLLYETTLSGACQKLMQH